MLLVSRNDIRPSCIVEFSDNENEAKHTSFSVIFLHFVYDEIINK